MARPGCTVWLTGLPGSGKSTLALLLHEYLQEHGLASEVLDGDELRKWLTAGLTFTKEDRDENIRRITYLANMLTRVGAFAIVAAISPYAEARARARQTIARFVEVHIDCPIEICRLRDPKGLYAKALRGQLPHFTGVSDPYEPPSNPELRLRTDRLSPDQCLQLILDKLAALQYIPTPVSRLHPNRSSAVPR